MSFIKHSHIRDNNSISGFNSVPGIVLVLFTSLAAQFQYNHPELRWQTFETEHFKIHFYEATEGTAREAAAVAERIYPHVTGLYDYRPPDKTHLIFTDTDDISNGIAYFYDNKIIIWASPLDYELRGSHRWLQNVITHEFVHIVSIQKAMKAGTKIPGAYLQWMGYEDEKRKDVLYGFPNALVSYPLPGTSVPPWLAEGSAQYMYDGATWDTWDSHRDMILRDRVLNHNLLSFTEMNTFGKKGIGNESTYNAGYALSRYIAVKYGPEKLKKIMENLSNPFQFSISNSIKEAIGISGDQLYADFKQTLATRYDVLTESVRNNEQKGRLIISDGTANLYPLWALDGIRFSYISNKENDYFGQTDLFVYNFENKEETKIASNVSSPATWHPNGKKIFYSKKPKVPNKNGSSYYDLFEYDFSDEEETRLTNDIRSYSPVYLANDSSIAFLASRDGNQNIAVINLYDRSYRQITDFNDRRIIHSLKLDRANNQLVFDYTTNHFRNIGFFSLEDSTLGDIMNNAYWDERNLTVTTDGILIYADDRSGIYNLFLINPNNGDQGYITNVFGGSFMPDVNDQGQILYSLYENGGYKIALIDTLQFIEDDQVGYNSLYYLRNGNLHEPITAIDSSTAEIYEDNFAELFILPKIMVDYGTIKPGFYFYSSEILERLSVFGGASINQSKDLDLFFIFEFRRLFPTLFMEVFYLTRNIVDNPEDVYQIDDNLKFRLTQFRGGLRFPLFGMSQLELYGIWQRYRAFIKRSIPQEYLEGGLAYDYFRGYSGGINWRLNVEKTRYDGNINPSNGFSIITDIAYENNDFIDSLDLSDAGTLVEEFFSHDLVRISIDGSYHWEIPETDRWTLSFKAMTAWLSNSKADSFFNFFGGGLTGIQGYPYYSIEGNRLAIMETTFRIPVFRGKHFPIGWYILQNSVVGFVFQFGDAWSDEFSMKKSAGIQLRMNGFSFYNYPTAIGLEVHRGLDNFTKEVNGDIIKYEKKNRYYLSVLFDF